MKPQSDLERLSAAEPAVLVQRGARGPELMLFHGGLTLLHYHAAHAPVIHAWDFELEDPELPPAADVIPDEEYSELAAAATQGGGRAERVRNQAEIDAVHRRNEVRRRAQWPWVWARAVLAETPPLPAAEDTSVNGRTRVLR